MEDGSGIMAAYIKICIYEYKHYNIYIFRKKTSLPRDPYWWHAFKAKLMGSHVEIKGCT
jgi:hypothetical protein